MLNKNFETYDYELTIDMDNMVAAAETLGGEDGLPEEDFFRIMEDNGMVFMHNPGENPFFAYFAYKEDGKQSMTESVLRETFEDIAQYIETGSYMTLSSTAPGDHTEIRYRFQNGKMKVEKRGEWEMTDFDDID